MRCTYSCICLFFLFKMVLWIEWIELPPVSICGPCLPFSKGLSNRPCSGKVPLWNYVVQTKPRQPRAQFSPSITKLKDVSAISVFSARSVTGQKFEISRSNWGHICNILYIQLCGVVPGLSFPWGSLRPRERSEFREHFEEPNRYILSPSECQASWGVTHWHETLEI